MQKGIVFISPLGARNKKSAVFDEIVSLCPDNDYSQVLYITPAAFSEYEAKKQFFSYLKSANKEVSYIPFRSFTLTNFCMNLYETFNPPIPPLSKGPACPVGRGEGGFAIISDRIEPLIFCELIGEKNIGYARNLSDLLSKMRHHILGRELSQVRENIKSLIFEEKTMKRAVKAIEFLELYEKELKGKGLIDFGGAIRDSAVLIKEYLKPSITVLDGFFDPTPLEKNIIKALIEKTDKAYFLVEENAEFLSFFPEDDSGTASSLEFKGAKFKVRKLKPSYSRNVAGYYAYPSMEDEVEGIARQVKKLILGGVKPNKIIISFPVLSKYTPMIRRVFKKHEIPVNITGYNLSVTKPFIALDEMISSIENDYPRNEFLSFLTSAVFPGIPENIKKWAVSFANSAGIVKGRSAWLSIRETILNSSEEEITESKNKILDEFQREIKKIINIFERLKEIRNLPLFVDELEIILSELGFFGSKTDQEDDFIEESLSSPYANDLSNKIRDLLFELRHFSMRYNSGNAGIESAAFYLRHMIKDLKGRDENVDGIRVVPFEHAAGIESEAIFFGGMVENDLPSKPDIDPVLPEKVKKELGLPFLEYYLDRQKRYFKRLLNASSTEPYFSYPAADSDKIFLPSPFLDWGMSLNLLSPDIYTKEDILISEGAFKQRNFSGIMWSGELTRNKYVKNALMKKFRQEIFIRVTDIDAYRQCPLKFYIERFLGFEMEKPPRFEVEARLWGKLAHKTMEELFKDGDIELELLGKRLFQGLEKSLQQYPIGEFWSNVAKEIFQRLLPMLKEQEINIRMQGFSPYMVEKPLKSTINNLRIKGKVDRIDIKKGRRDEGGGTRDENKDKVILLDYKTGSIDKDSLQLPLYAAIWQMEEAESVEKVGFYSLKDGRVEWYPKKPDMMDEFIQNALHSAQELVQKMREGIFIPLPSKEGNCRHCYHSALCKGAK